MRDKDTWTRTKHNRQWLVNKGATQLMQKWGHEFYENPDLGDEAPVLAIRVGTGMGGAVWNTQDFDLPTSDPREAW